MLPESPYKGLEPFSESENDAALFFGRDYETRIISASLRTRRLTLLYGPSGVGKTSLLHAGVIHNLRQLNAQLAFDLASLSDANFEGERLAKAAADAPAKDAQPLTDAIVVVTFENWSANDSHDLLRDAILASLEKSFPSIFTAEKKRQLRELRLSDLLLKIADCRQVLELLIILDQFEQYFVYHDVDQKRKDFADEFCRAALNRRLRANFLVSIREDWLASLDLFTGRVPSVFDNSIRIGHLDLESAKAAIWNPVQKYNELIQKQPGFNRKQVKIEESFVTEALNQLTQLDLSENDPESSESSSEPKAVGPRIQASGLQIVLQHLWNKVKTDDSPTLSRELLPPGAARRIFQSHLNDSLRPLSFREKLLAEKLFPFLSTSSGAKLADTADGLAERSRSKSDAVKALLKKLTQTRILNEHGPMSARAPQPLYEITSDVLSAPIQNWLRHRWLARRGVTLWACAIVAIIVSVASTVLLVNTINQRDRDAKRERQEKAEKIRLLYRKSDEQIPYLKAALRGHMNRVTSAVFTSDGQVLTSSADGSVVLWDPETWKPIREFTDDDMKPVVSAAINPAGTSVVTASTDGTVSLWARSTGENTQLREQATNNIRLRGPLGKHVTGISFSPNGDLIAVANTNGDLIIWNAKTLERIAERTGNGSPARQISFSPGGKFLGAALEDGTTRVWQVADWSQFRILERHRGRVNGLAFSPDENLIATASADMTVRLWDLSKGGYDEFAGHTGGVSSVDFDVSGKHVLTASDDRTARIWKVADKSYTELKGHTDKVLSASFSPDGSQVVTGSRDKSARIWSAESGKLLIELSGHEDEVTYVSYSGDGKYVLTASDDAAAIVWFAPDSRLFEIALPVIEAKPIFDYHGTCPVTISFNVSITALKGSGSVIYRFRGSDGRIWPTQELVFDKPGTKYLKWYWRITESTKGEESETIEIIEPAKVNEQSAKFKVTCTSDTTAAPTPTITPATSSPTSSVAPAPSPPRY